MTTLTKTISFANVSAHYRSLFVVLVRRLRWIPDHSRKDHITVFFMANHHLQQVTTNPDNQTPTTSPDNQNAYVIPLPTDSGCSETVSVHTIPYTHYLVTSTMCIIYVCLHTTKLVRVVARMGVGLIYFHMFLTLTETAFLCKITL